MLAERKSDENVKDDSGKGAKVGKAEGSHLDTGRAEGEISEAVQYDAQCIPSISATAKIQGIFAVALMPEEQGLSKGKDREIFFGVMRYGL